MLSERGSYSGWSLTHKFYS